MKSIQMLNKSLTIDSLIDNFMKYEGIYLLVAKPKAGKSLLALQLANAIANGIQVLNKETKQEPVLYVSTELSETQLSYRIRSSNYNFPDNYFFYLIKSIKNKLNIKEDLKNEIEEFATKYNGKLVIIDILVGIDYGYNFNLNDYKEIENYVIGIYKELSEKYHVTFLLIHHVNKKGDSLGSTGLEGFVDGIFYLIDMSDGKFLLQTKNRDFESEEINLIRNEKFQFEVTKKDVGNLPEELIIFIKYMIKKKDDIFTSSEMISTLNLPISADKFGSILNENIKKLEQEGITLSKHKTSTRREYHAHFKDPMENLEQEES